MGASLAVFVQMMLMILGTAGLIYTIAAISVMAPPMQAQPPRVAAVPVQGVTILKPLHGDEPGLAANLRTIFEQDHGAPVQLIFGASMPDDGALVHVHGVMAAFPGADVTVITDATRHGANNKMSNIINMAAHAKHPVIVICDSDVAAPRDTVTTLAMALADDNAGVVSCLHVGRGDAGGWSRLAAMDISYRFMPSVMLGARARLAHPVMGPMMALRADTLAAIGGFGAFSDSLADDFEMGRAVRRNGRTVIVSGPFVIHGCREQSLFSLIRHELRWTRTIFAIDRAGFAGSLVTHVVPLTLLALALGPSLPTIALTAAALGARVIMKMRMDAITGFRSGPVLLLPVRDLLSFVIFLATFFVGTVDWRGARFKVGRDGKLIPTRHS
jgi:ceramide glucosyltransferase